jgi:hypothetical protein
MCAASATPKIVETAVGTWNSPPALHDREAVLVCDAPVLLLVKHQNDSLWASLGPTPASRLA